MRLFFLMFFLLSVNAQAEIRYTVSVSPSALKDPVKIESIKNTHSRECMNSFKDSILGLISGENGIELKELIEKGLAFDGKSAKNIEEVSIEINPGFVKARDDGSLYSNYRLLIRAKEKGGKWGRWISDRVLFENDELSVLALEKCKITSAQLLDLATNIPAFLRTRNEFRSCTDEYDQLYNQVNNHSVGFGAKLKSMGKVLLEVAQEDPSFTYVGVNDFYEKKLEVCQRELQALKKSAEKNPKVVSVDVKIKKSEIENADETFYNPYGAVGTGVR